MIWIILVTVHSSLTPQYVKTQVLDPRISVAAFHTDVFLVICEKSFSYSHCSKDTVVLFLFIPSFWDSHDIDCEQAELSILHSVATQKTVFFTFFSPVGIHSYIFLSFLHMIVVCEIYNSIAISSFLLWLKSPTLETHFINVRLLIYKNLKDFN
jgi:hypothetical protein